MNRVPTGADFLDKLLQGGYECDAITTIYGPSGAGKTNLMSLASIATALRGKKVVFVDTEGGFSVTRLQQMVGGHKKVLSRMMFLRPTTFEEQSKAFQKLKELMKSRASRSFGLVVVDTIGMLYRLERKFGESAYHQELGLQLTALNELCRKRNIPVLLANQVYSQPGESALGMVGGDMVRYTSKCLIELQILQGGRRRLVLRKHRSLPEIDKIFEITSTGIKEN